MIESRTGLNKTPKDKQSGSILTAHSRSSKFETNRTALRPPVAKPTETELEKERKKAEEEAAWQKRVRALDPFDVDAIPREQNPFA